MNAQIVTIITMLMEKIYQIQQAVVKPLLVTFVDTNLKLGGLQRLKLDKCLI